MCGLMTPPDGLMRLVQVKSVKHYFVQETMDTALVIGVPILVIFAVVAIVCMCCGCCAGVCAGCCQCISRCFYKDKPAVMMINQPQVVSTCIQSLKVI